MADKLVLDELSIYIPQSKAPQRPVERFTELDGKRDRSINYPVVEVIMQYPERKEGVE